MDRALVAFGSDVQSHRLGDFRAEPFLEPLFTNLLVMPIYALLSHVFRQPVQQGARCRATVRLESGYRRRYPFGPNNPPEVRAAIR